MSAAFMIIAALLVFVLGFVIGVFVCAKSFDASGEWMGR